jgi:hypothetical protein
MQYSSRKIVIILVFLALAWQFLLFPVSAPEPASLPDGVSNSSLSNMYVGVYVNSIDNIDFVKGTYTMDFYLHFLWADPRIPRAHFELMNGQLSPGPNSLDKLSENKTGPIKEEWYRVRADLNTDTNNHDFPFESGTLPIEIEDAANSAPDLLFISIDNESDVEPEFISPGWSIGKPTFLVDNHSYPWGQTYSRLSYRVPIDRDQTDAIVQTLIPPLIFCFIAFLSFFIKVEHNELVHLRYVLTTTMFITAVMYQFTEVSVLPSLAVFNLFDKYMVAVYLFLSATIVVTTLCYLAQWQWQRPGLVKYINRYGMVVSIFVPIVSFVLLIKLINPLSALKLF